MVGNKDRVGQWPKAARFWKQIGPPLRPVAEDVLFVRNVLNEWGCRPEGKPPQALILGVTPEFYHLPWPAGTSLKAVDRTPAMIEYVWPGPVEAVTQADWLHIPYQQASMDLVLCDGGLHLLAYPDEQTELANKLAYVLAPGGYCVFRLFVPPATRETVDEVAAELLAGNIENLNYLKLRLGMALQRDAIEGIRLDTVWQALHAIQPDQVELARHLGWEMDHLSAINAYRDSVSRYHFVTIDEAIATFCAGTGGAFQIERKEWPNYRMGSQFPTIVFRRTD